ncbi:MAG TPA: T9SS type A sorting domain-containing protein [Saprospiraceae bacterium]|nr:T9SS type A sorting domain-containing protein [Saprospiraceae bacterium]
MPQTLINVIKNSTIQEAHNQIVVLAVDGIFRSGITQPISTNQSMNFAKSKNVCNLFFILIFLFPLFGASQTTYTFHTAGNWSDAANWSPSYPGLTISSGSIVNIDADCLVENLIIVNNGTINVNDFYFDIVNLQSGTYFANNGLIDFIGIPNSLGCSIIGVFENNGELKLQGTCQLSIQGVFNSIGDISSNGYGSINEYLPSTINISELSPNFYFGVITTSSCTPIQTYNIDINGTTTNIDYDHIDFYGACADLTNSILNVTWGFTPSVGQTFDIITHDSRLGQFATLNIPPISGLSFMVDYSDPTKTSIVVSQALPITLISFNVFGKTNETNLQWKTSSETNNHYYDIEHNTDGTEFIPIGRKEGGGNSNTLLDYHFAHKDVDAGLHYYRLKQVDYDGNYSYSDIKSVLLKGEDNDVSIYPNPTANIININGANGLHYTLLDIFGTQVMDGQISDDMIAIDHLTTGMYYLYIESENGKRVYKILKK